MSAPCSCQIATWAAESPVTTWRGMDRLRDSHHFEGCRMFTTADQLQKDRELHRLKFPVWRLASDPAPLSDGRGYWVACLTSAGGEGYTAIGFWDSRAAGFRWNSGPLMNNAYAYAEIDFPAPPEKEKGKIWTSRNP